MKNILIIYPKCSTCQKAKNFLDENRIEYIEKNIVTETPTYEELKNIIKMSGVPVNKFFNTSGMLYRSKNLKEKLKDLSDDEKLKLLSDNGMLIKRPIFLKQSKAYVGFKEETWKEILEK